MDPGSASSSDMTAPVSSAIRIEKVYSVDSATMGSDAIPKVPRQRQVDKDGFVIPTIPPNRKTQGSTRKVSSTGTKIKIQKVEKAITDDPVSSKAMALFASNLLIGERHGSVWCRLCGSGQVATSWSRLLLHCATTHMENTILRCKICGFQCAYFNELQQHRKDAHPDLAPPIPYDLFFSFALMLDTLDACFGETATSKEPVVKGDPNGGYDEPSDQSVSNGAKVLASRDPNTSQPASQQGDQARKERKRPAVDTDHFASGSINPSTLPLKKRKISFESAPVTVPTFGTESIVKTGSKISDMLDELLARLPSKKLECSLCHQLVRADTGYYDAVLKHVADHLGKPGFRCGLCGEEFETKPDVEDHIIRFHDCRATGLALTTMYEDILANSEQQVIDEMRSRVAGKETNGRE